jgi:putative oxidoreductase
VNRLLGPYGPHAYALLRIVAGFLFLCHGLPKMFGVLGGFGGTPGATAPLFSQIGLAGIIEVGGGLLLMLGLFTAQTAFICSGEMAVAYFQSHLPRGFWPLRNGGELAALYSFLFLYIATQGAGICSLDKLIRKRS